MLLTVRCAPKLAVLPGEVTVWVAPVSQAVTTLCIANHHLFSYYNTASNKTCEICVGWIPIRREGG